MGHGCPRRFVQRRGWRWTLIGLAALGTMFGNATTAHGEQPVANVGGNVAAGPLPSDARFGAVEAFRAPNLASAAGVRWERILFWWQGLQPNGPQDWNQYFLEEGTLAAELAAGRTVVGCLLNPPRWANGTGRPPDPPKNLYLPYDSPDNYWGQFVRRVAARYRGRIDQWIIGNEPDVWDKRDPGFTWNGSVADYYQFLKVAYQAAKAANPNATVISAGLTYWWDAQYGQDQYFRRLLEVARRDPSAAANNWYFDVAALQLYNDPKGLLEVPRLFRRLMAEAGIPQKPIWITETNVAPWNDAVDPLPRERFRATLDEQASYIIQAFAYALVGGVEKIEVYKMSDLAGLPRGVERYGLARSDGSYRPAYEALRTVGRYLSGTRGGSVANEAGTVRIALDKGDEVVTVVWNATPQQMVTSIPARGASGILVEQAGTTKTVQAQNGAFTLTLPPATANTIPGEPNTYRIGGRPYLLVEKKGAFSALQLLSEANESRSEREEVWNDSATGYSVSGPWLTSFRAMGGLDNIGRPRSEVIRDPIMGRQTLQLFQRAVLEYHGKNPEPYRIQRRLLADILYPGADDPADAAAAPPGPSTYFAQSTDYPTGLGHFVADYTLSGQPVYFKQYFDVHGGVDAFGYPKEEPKLRDGKWTQRFQAAVFEYHPELDHDGLVPGTDIPYRNYRVQLALLGDEYLSRNGLPVQ